MQRWPTAGAKGGRPGHRGGWPGHRGGWPGQSGGWQPGLQEVPGPGTSVALTRVAARYSALSTTAGWVRAAVLAGMAAIRLARARTMGNASSVSGEMTGTGTIAAWPANRSQA